MERCKLVWTQSTVIGTSKKYPADTPGLEANKDYLLIIKGNDTQKTSSVDPNKGLGFQLVGEEQANEIEGKRKIFRIVLSWIVRRRNLHWRFILIN